MTDPLGWFVIDGHQVPIVGVELHGGKVHFVGSVDGPIPAASGWITVVGRDGQRASARATRSSPGSRCAGTRRCPWCSR